MAVTNLQQTTASTVLISDFARSAVMVSTTADVCGTSAALRQTEQVDAHLLILPIAGEGSHSVDFSSHHVASGTLIHVQPGQVHRWSDTIQFEADVISIRSDLCPPGLFSPIELQPKVVLGTAHAVMLAVVSYLRREIESPEPDPAVIAVSATLLMHQTARAGRNDSGPTAATAQTELLRSFRTELENEFSKTRSVAEYARRVGTSTKTLSRVTGSLVGQSPKEVIDQRVILEARRMLAHSTESAASIGASLGFSEPTNFTKFFTRHTGSTPQEFRVDV